MKHHYVTLQDGKQLRLAYKVTTFPLTMLSSKGKVFENRFAASMKKCDKL